MQESAQTGYQLKLLCVNILDNTKECGVYIKELQKLLPAVPPPVVQRNLSTLLCIAYPLFKNLSEDKNCYRDKEKEALVDAFRIIFEKATVDKIGVFFNFCGFLLSELYDPAGHKILPTSEEYKLIIVQCLIALTKSLSWDITLGLYKKENTPKLCQALYVSLEIAKHEKLRSLRLAAIELLMCLAQIHDGAEIEDLELRYQVANVFMFFLPGLASGLRSISLEDEKSGHKITVMALRAWGRIVALHMEDFNSSDDGIDLLSSNLSKTDTPALNPKVKWKSATEVKNYIENSSRSLQWYIQTDENLHKIISTFSKLIKHPHAAVRLELARICCLLLNRCNKTMPKCISQAVHILMGCSEDEDNEVKTISHQTLRELSESLSSNLYASLIEQLEENFYSVISSLPRIFNRRDRNEQLIALKLLIGYINLFGTYKLSSLLLSPTYLNHLLKTLLHICELEENNIRLLEEIANPDLEMYCDSSQWKQFHYFLGDDEVRRKLESICGLFCKFGVADVVSDFLLDILLNEPKHKCEAIFLLNHLFKESNVSDNDKHIAKTIISTYLEPEHWNLDLTVTDDTSLKDIRKNILQVCLQTEGTGIFACTLQKEFEPFMLKCLYSILERAGSSHPLIRQSGLTTLKNVIQACGYNNVTEFINVNSDYFAYHVTKKLNKLEYNKDVLNVLAVVMDYSTVDVLQSLSHIIEVVLAQSCDKFQRKYVASYLRVFNIFIKCLHRWFDIKIVEEPIKSKLQKRREYEEFKISGMSEANNFSDDIMGKTAEEMYKEDMAKKQEELLESHSEEYKKPMAPMHVNMTVAILKRSLNFLPSKDRRCKILALEVLRNGLEVVRDWEDELLPVVHQIWSPLVDRFVEHKEPLVINLSFQLLTVMARLSKDFIRARTTKDVLPQILHVMKSLSKESYLKDKGSSYRYTQAYKLQLTILQQLAQVISNLEVADDRIENVMDVVRLYLDKKQPLPLREAAASFFKALAVYDSDLTKKRLQIFQDEQSCPESKANIIALLESLIKLPN